MTTTTNHAPYRDPMGHPSWQPSPAVRRSDAKSRINRKLRDTEHTIDVGLRQLESLIKRFPLAEYGGGMRLRETLETEREKARLHTVAELNKLHEAPDDLNEY